MQKLGVLYNQLPNKRAICNLCARSCNIPEESMGFCGVRKNINGKIYSTNQIDRRYTVSNIISFKF